MIRRPIRQIITDIWDTYQLMRAGKRAEKAGRVMLTRTARGDQRPHPSGCGVALPGPHAETAERLSRPVHASSDVAHRRAVHRSNAGLS